MEAFVIAKKYVYFLTGILIFLGLYLTSLHSYLLFHSLVEIFSIVVACGIFMVVWNSRRFLDNNYLLFIGIAYLFVGGLDLVHTLAYTGMGVFQGYETNLPTQLWIAARYMESISFLIAPLLFRRKLKVNLIFLGYVLATSILLLSIFYWNIFPVCFIEGMGLTPFKKISEYIISLILLASIVLLLKKRNEFDSIVLQWVVWSIILTIISELAFTFYIHAYGFSNLVGHYLKVVSFYLIYKAIIDTDLKQPYDLMFRNLKKNEEALRDALKESQQRQGEISALLEGARAVLGYQEFTEAARSLFDSCKNLIGATAGYVSLASKDGTQNEALFVDSGEFPCTVDPSLPMPIRGLREIAFRTGKTVFHNDFPKSEYIQFVPEGHSSLSNVLFAPLVIKGKAVGLFGLSNKSGVFTENDARMASTFGELAAIALVNIRAEEQLQKAHDELEKRVLERTRELAKTNEELQAEITERKRAEEAVKAEQQRFKDVLDQLPAYLVLLSPDYHVPFANRFFRERFGESHGRRCFEYLFDRSEPCEICETYTVLKTNAPHHWEWTGPDSRNYDIYDFPFTDTDGSNLIMEVGLDITERKRAQEALNAASLYTRSLIEASLDPLVTISADGKIMDVNKATELVTGVSREYLIGTDFSDYFTDPKEARKGYKEVFSKGFVTDYPLSIRHISGKVTDVLYHATVYKNKAGVVQGVFAAARDITVRKELQRRIEATNSLLNLFVRMSSRKEYLDGALGLIQRWSGCRCVGIRVLDEKDYIPYESYAGFDREFWESENLLSVKYNQCACIRVVTGNLDPQDLPVSTPAGSFRCENTFEFIGSLSEEEKARFRGVCIKSGFKSVAVIPVRYRDKVLGAIHLADEKEGKVPIDNVEFIESMAPLIGEAIIRFNLEAELKDSEKRLRHLSSQLLTVQENERKRISREIHDGLGQSLSAIKFKTESITQQMRDSRHRNIAESFEAILPIIQESIEESRRIQMDLRPSILDDLGIIATLNWFSREFQKTYSDIHIDKEIDIQENEVPDTLKTVIYRISQEAMNNIAKHSQANLIRLSLRRTGNKIELSIVDNGMGFDLENFKKGLGLTSMRERTELSGGSFTIESILGKGTTIRASWAMQ